MRYLIFGFDSYHPSGGLNDLACQADSLREAFKTLLKTREDWDCVQILDTVTGDSVRTIEDFVNFFLDEQ